MQLLFWHPYRGARVARMERVRGRLPSGPADNGGVQVVSAACWTNLSGHPWGPLGSSRPRPSSAGFAPMQCLLIGIGT